MNLFQILDKLTEVDGDALDRLDTRRSSMREFAEMGKKVAVAALPLAMASVFKKAYGVGERAGVVDVLNYALTLEYLEAEFYTLAVAQGTNLIPAGPPTGAITTIRDHEIAHVNLLKSAIQSLGGTPVAKPTFDFTAGNGSGNGPLAGVFSNYALFLVVAQAFEDTGVRAYKGRAADLINFNYILRTALRIHSVEARHASHIRYMRRRNGQDPNIKPWITGEMSPSPLVDAVYDGEDNTNQGGVNTAALPMANFQIATEAYDEPLSPAQVLAIVDPFIV